MLPNQYRSVGHLLPGHTKRKHNDKYRHETIIEHLIHFLFHMLLFGWSSSDVTLIFHSIFILFNIITKLSCPQRPDLDLLFRILQSHTVDPFQRSLKAPRHFLFQNPSTVCVPFSPKLSSSYSEKKKQYFRTKVTSTLDTKYRTQVRVSRFLSVLWQTNRKLERWGRRSEVTWQKLKKKKKKKGRKKHNYKPGHIDASSGEGRAVGRVLGCHQNAFLHLQEALRPD